MMSSQSLEKRRYVALDKWTNALESVHAAIVGKNPSGGKVDPAIEMGMGMQMGQGWS
jgi:COP9 signalosome complex subunit 2